MSPLKAVAAIIIVLSVISYLIYPDPKIEPVDPSQLPWTISIDEQNNSSVFDLKFNHDTLEKAMSVLGEPEKMALYADPKKPNIEVYFGNVTQAGLTAKIILRLNLTSAQAEQFLDNAGSRMQSNASIPKIKISPKDRAKTLHFTISSLTYIPLYSGLDKNYLISRFGMPDYQITLSETAQQLFYPKLGISVIVDSEGKEVFQYTQPILLMVPKHATAYEE